MSIEREEEKKIIATTTIVNNEENVKKNTQWYVIRCYSAQEKKAKKSIESQLKINNFEDKINFLLHLKRTISYHSLVG
jgi:transcription antitermination factor NusG